MAQYKLYYFEFRGRAEIIRLLFAAAGEKYEDIRFPREKWPEFKTKAPFGQAPFMEITDGSNTFAMGQSLAITRYLARKFGLAGKNDHEYALIEMYADQITDLVNEVVKAFRETDPDKKKEIEEKVSSEFLPANMKLLEDRLAKSNSGFIAPSGLTWVDLYLFTISDWFPKKETVFENFKLIKAHHDKVAAIPGIANWLKVRPVTEM